MPAEDTSIPQFSRFESEVDPPLASVHANEFTCPICLSLFYEPVTVPCGHTFCKRCITAALSQNAICSVCRSPVTVDPLALSPNVLLISIIKSAWAQAYQQRHMSLVSEPTTHLPRMGIFVSDVPHFPAQKLALYIFEPRYRVLINQAMIGNRQFLIVSTQQMDIATGRRSLLDVPLRLTGPLGDRRAVVAVRAAPPTPTSACARAEEEDVCVVADTSVLSPAGQAYIPPLSSSSSSPLATYLSSPVLSFVRPHPPRAHRRTKRPRTHQPTPHSTCSSQYASPAWRVLDALTPLGFGDTLRIHSPRSTRATHSHSPPQPHTCTPDAEPLIHTPAADAHAHAHADSRGDVSPLRGGRGTQVHPPPSLSPAPSLALSPSSLSATSSAQTPTSTTSSQSSLTVPHMIPTPSQLADMDPHPYGQPQGDFTVPSTLTHTHALAAALRDSPLLRPFGVLTPPPISAYGDSENSNGIEEAPSGRGDGVEHPVTVADVHTDVAPAAASEAPVAAVGVGVGNDDEGGESDGFDDTTMSAAESTFTSPSMSMLRRRLVDKPHASYAAVNVGEVDRAAETATVAAALVDDGHVAGGSDGRGTASTTSGGSTTATAATAAPLASPAAREWTYALSLAQYLSVCAHADKHLANAATQLRKRAHSHMHLHSNGNGNGSGSGIEDQSVGASAAARGRDHTTHAHAPTDASMHPHIPAPFRSTHVLQRTSASGGSDGAGESGSSASLRSGEGSLATNDSSLSLGSDSTSLASSSSTASLAGMPLPALAFSARAAGATDAAAGMPYTRTVGLAYPPPVPTPGPAPTHTGAATRYGLPSLPPGTCVGVLATVESCQSYPDGRLLVQATGARRVLVRSVRSEGGRYGLWSGEYEAYEDVWEEEEEEEEEEEDDEEQEGERERADHMEVRRRRRGTSESSPYAGNCDDRRVNAYDNVAAIATVSATDDDADNGAVDAATDATTATTETHASLSTAAARGHARLALLCAEVEWLAALSTRQLRVAPAHLHTIVGPLPPSPLIIAERRHAATQPAETSTVQPLQSTHPSRAGPSHSRFAAAGGVGASARVDAGGQVSGDTLTRTDDISSVPTSANTTANIVHADNGVPAHASSPSSGPAAHSYPPSFPSDPDNPLFSTFLSRTAPPHGLPPAVLAEVDPATLRVYAVILADYACAMVGAQTSAKDLCVVSRSVQQRLRVCALMLQEAMACKRRQDKRYAWIIFFVGFLAVMYKYLASMGYFYK